jgi:DNA repair photolyase
MDFYCQNNTMKIKNRGTHTNAESRFETYEHEAYDDGWYTEEEESLSPLETILLPEKAKTIITRNDSPDIGFDQSINPYRGCEHGCVYCYARPSHGYMNLSSGLDFETKLFYKVDAARLLEEELNKSNYKCDTIVLGANTDPYQPIESKLKITRSLLEIFNKYNHPIGIITKSSMIERDLDILSDMAKRHLVSAAVSVTTLSNPLKLILEPRTSGPRARLRTIKNLTAAGVPVRALTAPMIPLINDMELEKILAAVKNAGANHASYVLVRLPHDVKDLFREWLKVHFPDRAEHVMSIIRQMRGGKDYDAAFGKRMKGEGEFAELLKMRFRIACKRLELNVLPAVELDYSSFKKLKNPSHQQIDLF